MSWKPVFIMNDNERAYNGQRFATQEEARLSADRRFGVWTMPVDFTTEESDDPVNYVFDPIKGDVSVSTQFTWTPVVRARLEKVRQHITPKKDADKVPPPQEFLRGTAKSFDEAYDLLKKRDDAKKK